MEKNQRMENAVTRPAHRVPRVPLVSPTSSRGSPIVPFSCHGVTEGARLAATYSTGAAALASARPPLDGAAQQVGYLRDVLARLPKPADDAQQLGLLDAQHRGTALDQHHHLRL